MLKLGSLSMFCTMFTILNYKSYWCPFLMIDDTVFCHQPRDLEWAI